MLKSARLHLLEELATILKYSIFLGKEWLVKVNDKALCLQVGILYMHWVLFYAYI